MSSVKLLDSLRNALILDDEMQPSGVNKLDGVSNGELFNDPIGVIVEVLCYLLVIVDISFL